MWLTAPVVEEGEDGKKRYHPNDRGTPQGGVISPLLANIYLNILDTLWKIKRIQEEYGARLIRYADDFVVLCRGNTERVRQGVERVLAHVGLSLNEQKTRTVDAREESFNFLGYTVKLVRSTRTGRVFPLVTPSRKAVQQVKTEIKRLTREAYLVVPLQQVIKKLNSVARGWENYFRYGHCSRQLWNVKRHLEGRVRRHLMRKRGKSGWGYKTYTSDYLYRLGLYKMTTSAPWKTTAKACG
jgi:RNA-directed DNA polymerase